MILRATGVVFAMTVLCHGVAGSEELAAALVRKVKAATVYIEADEGTGSGVLFKKSGTSGWVLTCAHVVGRAKRVRLVFDSGTPAERVVTGTVTGADTFLDLACCSIQDSKDLPEPLTVGTKTEIREEAPCFIAGFPFGAGLGVGGKRPEITITVAKLDSILKDENGEPGLLQLLGEVNPGNSGGPVLDSKGKVIGICASKFVGTQTSFSVPGESFRRFLLGTATKVDWQPAAKTDSTCRNEVIVQLSDPFGNIRSAGVAFGRKDRIQSVDEPVATAGWKKCSDTLKEVPLKVDPLNRTCSGTIESSRGTEDEPEQEIIFQVYWVQADGTKGWSVPQKHVLSFNRRESDSKPHKKDLHPASMEPPPCDVAALPVLKPTRSLELNAVVPDLFLTPDGAALLALDLSAGRLLRIGTKSLEIESAVDAGEDAASMAMSPDGKLLAIVSRKVEFSETGKTPFTFSGVVTVVDPVALKVLRTIAIRNDPADSVLNDQGLLYVTGNPGLSVADVSTGKVLEFEIGTGARDAFPRFHRDQGRIYLGSAVFGAHFNVCVLPEIGLDGRSRRYQGPVSPEFPAGGDLELSPDGSRLVTMYGGVARLSKSQALDMMPERTIAPWTAFAFCRESDRSFGSGADGVLRQYTGPTFAPKQTWNLGARATRLVANATGERVFAINAPLPLAETAAKTAEMLENRRTPAGTLVLYELGK